MPPMGARQQREGEVERLSFLLCHALRVELLGRYGAGETSPKEAAEALGRPLGLVTHHTKVLYDEGHGLIEVTGKLRVRGTVATFYRLKPWGTRTSLGADGHTPNEVAQLMFLEFLIEAIAGAPEQKGAYASHRLMMLDEPEREDHVRPVLSEALEVSGTPESVAVAAQAGREDSGAEDSGARGLYACGVTLIPLAKRAG